MSKEINQIIEIITIISLAFILLAFGVGFFVGGSIDKNSDLQKNANEKCQELKFFKAIQFTYYNDGFKELITRITCVGENLTSHQVSCDSGGCREAIIEAGGHNE